MLLFATALQIIGRQAGLFSIECLLLHNKRLRTMLCAYRRQASAIFLLTVFISMLLASVIHRHELPAANETCAECVQHLPHAGHIQPGAQGVDCCLICQLLTDSYLPASVSYFLFLIFFIPAVSVALTSLRNGCAFCRSPRAPPVVL